MDRLIRVIPFEESEVYIEKNSDEVLESHGLALQKYAENFGIDIDFRNSNGSDCAVDFSRNGYAIFQENGEYSNIYLPIDLSAFQYAYFVSVLDYLENRELSLFLSYYDCFKKKVLERMIVSELGYTDIFSKLKESLDERLMDYDFEKIDYYVDLFKNNENIIYSEDYQKVKRR